MSDPGSTLHVDARFNGPPDAGNGGYVAAFIARHLAGDAVVRLHRPAPLETDLQIRVEDGRAALVHGELLIAHARSEALDVEVPDPPDVAEAAAASSGFPDFEDHVFPRCFVCGPARPPGDGLRIFAGPRPGAEGVAAVWTPHAAFGDGEGRVRPEIVWCALDCPGAYAVQRHGAPRVLLGEYGVRTERAVPVGEPHVVTAWWLGSRGRKHAAGSALFDAAGRRCAVGRATWIAV